MRRGRILWLVILAIPLLWFLGLLGFVAMIPAHPTGNTEATDAIIVLTGSSGRVETGFDLWSKGRAKKLFISGVGKGVNLKAIYRLAGTQTPVPLPKSGPANLIVLGYDATDTRGNAREAADWMQKEGFTSARLVTANYHVPRSLLEFSHAMPDYIFIAEPVFPSQFHADEWWRYPGTARLIFSEYHKTLASAADHALNGWLSRVTAP